MNGYFMDYYYDIIVTWRISPILIRYAHDEHRFGIRCRRPYETILEKLTSNPILGVVVGALITAVIQSSSATTVMVVGFVNVTADDTSAGCMMIMGANIGTTITGQLVALNASEIAPVLAIIGVIMVTFLKNKKVNAIGEILAGTRIVFIGMGTMSSAMEPLRESLISLDLLTTISNPVLAILVGAGFTALIQSSSASVGILQTLALSGLIPLSVLYYIIFGHNIGTCITSALASLNANRNPKRTTIIHLSFKLSGTILFMIFTSITPFVDFMVSITDNPAAQIANTHTIFNIVTTLLLLPFGKKLARLAEIILPIKEEELDKDKFDVPLNFIDIWIISVLFRLQFKSSQGSISNTTSCLKQILTKVSKHFMDTHTMPKKS